MKKRTKGLVVLAAGAALTLTSGATLALWRASEPLPESQVTTGVLDLAWPGTAHRTPESGYPVVQPITWEVQRRGSGDFQPVAVSGPNVSRFEAGDVLRGSTSVDATLLGANLLADLEWDGELYDRATVDQPWTLVTDRDNPLIPASALTVTIDGNEHAAPLIDLTSRRPSIPVTVAFTIPQVQGDAQLDLGAIRLVLTQRRGDL